MLKRGQTEGSRRTQFQPGRSGNPGGRAKGVAAAIKKLVGEDGQKLWDAWYAVAFGNDQAITDVLGKSVKVTAADKMRALAELRDSGFGRPMQSMTTDQGDTVAVPESIQFVIRKADDGTSQS